MRESNKTLKTLALPLFLVVALLLGLFASALYEEKQLVPSMRANKPLPEFSAKVLFSDRIAHSTELRGNYFLLNFWGSWCPTCHVEHPYLMQLKQQGIKIIGVNYKDSESNAAEFLSNKGNPYEFSFFDPKGHIAIEMGITAAPETFLISPEGEVIFHRVGEMNERVFVHQIKPLMETN
jgi:cytochrome c biogenesis protein CcmG/thiol:disulfide interchange protein DsbE